MPTGLEIITDALQALGFLGQNQTLSGAESSKGLRIANDFIASLNRERLMIFRTVRSTATWAASAQTRTIATGGQIALARPDRIIAAGRLDTNSPVGEYPITVLKSILQYRRITQKAMTSELGQAIFYDAAYPTGTINIWPVPTTAFTIALYLWARLSALVLADDVSLPDGYNRFLRTNLAVEFAPAFNMPVTQEMLMMANAAKENIKSLNIENAPVGVDPAALGSSSTGGGYNILSDTYDGRPASS